MIGDRVAQAVGAGQGQGDAGNAGLAAVLDAVVVAVGPDEVTDGDRLDEAGVDGVVGLARGQGVAAGDAGAVGIGVGRVGGEGVAADILGGQDVAAAAGGGEVDVIGAGGQVGEVVGAGGIGGDGGDRVAVQVHSRLAGDAVVQGDGDPGQAGLAGVLLAVAVAVLPDQVADGGGLLSYKAGIDGLIRFARGKGNELAETRCGICVTVVGIGGAHSW